MVAWDRCFLWVCLGICDGSDLALGGKMISKKTEQRLNNLRLQLHRVKKAKTEQTISESLADRLIVELAKRIQMARG